MHVKKVMSVKRITNREIIRMLRLLKKLIVLSSADKLRMRKRLIKDIAATRAHSAHPVFVNEDLKAVALAEPYNKPVNPEAAIKILAIVDSEIDFLDEVEDALTLQRSDYLVATEGRVDVQTTIIREELFNLPWKRYWGENWGVDISWIKTRTQKIREKYGDQFDTIVFIIDFDNWTRQGNITINGWNLGTFYPDQNGYQIQLIKAGRHSQRALYLTLLMELFHAHDDFYRRATGKSLEQYFGVTNFDDNIVHGMAGQGEVLSQEDSVRMFGEGYDRWNYRPAFKAMTGILINLFRINPTEEDMYFEKQDEGSKNVFAISGGTRFLVLNWDTFEKINPTKKVAVNENLKSIPWGGVMIIAPDEDPLA